MSELAPFSAGAGPGREATPRDAPLALDLEEFREVGHVLVDWIAGLLDTMPSRPLVRDSSPAELRALLGGARSLPEGGSDLRELLGSTVRLLFDHSLFNGHPRFFGYVTSSPAPVGMLAELLSAAVNANVGAWQLAPVASEIEGQAVRWIAELIGYPADCGGLFVSGGNMANMVGLLTARASVTPWDVRGHGVAAAGSRPLRLYASVETHTWIQKAADLAGLGTDSIRWIPTDADQRIDTAALRAALAHDAAVGDHPLMVVGSAGTVSTGAIDPLAELAAICREHGAWFHVDGAYGAFAAALPAASAELRALALADSVALDPHKWLYAPLEAGCVLVRDGSKLRNAFAYHPPYYHFGQEATNYVEYGPQNSRGFRALKVWLALQQVGRSGYVRMIGDDVALSERLHERVSQHEELEACTQSLSITTFRYVPRSLRASIGSPECEAYMNRLNEALLERIQASGEVFVSNAVVQGRFLLRACIVNFNTSAADIDAIPGIIVRLGGGVHAELGGIEPHPA